MEIILILGFLTICILLLVIIYYTLNKIQKDIKKESELSQEDGMLLEVVNSSVDYLLYDTLKKQEQYWVDLEKYENAAKIKKIIEDKFPDGNVTLIL